VQPQLGSRKLTSGKGHFKSLIPRGSGFVYHNTCGVYAIKKGTLGVLEKIGEPEVKTSAIMVTAERGGRGKDI